MDLDLRGKTALVSGSSGGIGKAIAEEMAAEGAVVIVHGRDTARTQAVAEAIRADGGVAHWVTGQLDTNEGSRVVVEAVKGTVGHLDILVNNVGTFETSGWSQATPERWLETYQSCALSVVRLVQAFHPAMQRTGWGRIIQISSISALIAPTPFPDYGAAKASVLNMTVSLAKHLAGSGITVNTVSPGPIETETWERFAMQLAAREGWQDDLPAVKEKLLAGPMSNPSGRLGQPVDVAKTVAFLASPAAAMINGVNLCVDGGLSATVR